MIKYTIIENENRQPTICAVLEDGTILSIPMDLANSDYQAYLAAQSTPIVTEDE
jgi:hypothetical protein